ncbi:MAG TPA: hypothetical protein VH650_02135 [Gaiellaceae bacterium]|jgi:hypothetical protein
MGEFERLRARVESILDLADEQLVLQERGRLRLAVEERHGDWFALVGGLPMQTHAERLVGLVGDADRELSPEQVRELEGLIRRRLPRYPAPP